MSSVLLLWDHEGAVNFVVRRAPMNSTGTNTVAPATVIATVGDVREYLDESVVYGAWYEYSVLAKNAEGETSPASLPLAVRVVTPAPDAPYGLDYDIV